MKRFFLTALLLLGICVPLPAYSQASPSPDYALIDKQIKQFAAILIHDGRDLERISSDLIEIFLLMDKKNPRRWNLQSTIHSLNEIAKIMEHEALLINIGLDYVNENEKLLFYNNILKNRLEQYRKDIDLSLELIIKESFLITDEAAINHINAAKEICQNTRQSHDRYIEILKSLETQEIQRREQ